MKIAIAFTDGRVASVGTEAEGVLIVTIENGRITSQEKVGCHINGVHDLISVAQTYQFDVVVCGGDNLESREILHSYNICLIDDISCSIERAIEALEDNTLWAEQKNKWIPDSSKNRRYGFGVSGLDTVST